jgi:hypothetical protein
LSYTNDVEANPNLTLQKFGWDCALAFLGDRGSWYELRRTPDTYELREAEKSRAELARLVALTPDEVAAEARAENERLDAEYVISLAKTASRRSNLRRMQNLVLDWKPGPAVQSLKDFMLAEISHGLKASNLVSHKRLELENPGTPEVWYAEAIKEAQRRVAYHEAEYAKELAQVETYNSYVEALIEALGPPPGCA